jgi:nucleoside-diphosphate-sugar epimerase
MAAVLVTGAAGFAGSHLVDLLAHSGATVIGWRRPGSATPSNAPDIEWHFVDLLDRHAVARAVAAIRPETVYHCAGSAHVGQSWTDTRETLREGERAGADSRFRARLSAIGSRTHRR